MHLILLLSVQLLFCGNSVISGVVMKQADISINEHLEKLALQVGERYFSNLKCMVVLRERGLLKNIQLKNTSVTYIELNSTDKTCVQEVAKILNTTFKDNCNGYIIQFVNPFCAFEGWLEIYFHKSVFRHNPKYFFLPVYPNTLTYGDKLLSLRESDITVNFLVSELQINSTDWSVILYTNNFYLHPSTPGRNPKLYMDEWHYLTGFKENVDLYPDKVKDLKGKVFRIATGSYLPLASADPLDGTEIRIALIFCKKHNCTVEPVTDDMFWGTVYDNLTADGVVGNVYNDKADVGGMAVYLWVNESYYVDYTSAYLGSDSTAMCPKPTKVGGIVLPFLPFKLDMWIAFFISLILSATSLYFITRASIKFTRFSDRLLRKTQFTTIEDSSLRAIGLAVLQQPSSRLIGDSPNRYLFTSFEFLYLVLTAMYGAELASFLTVPKYHPPIDTFHEFGTSGRNWYGTHGAWVYALQDAIDLEARIIAANFRVTPVEELKRLIKTGKLCFTIERLPGGSVIETEFETEDVIPMYHIMKEPLVRSPIVASIKKGSPYLTDYNSVINRAIDHGHYLYWEGDVARKYLNQKIQSAYEQIKTVRINRSPGVIRVSNIVGVIFIFFIGIALSCVLFVIEIIQYRYEKKNINIFKRKV